MRKRWIALTLGACAIGGVAGWSIYHTFVKKSRTFIFANWENYMSSVVQNYLADKYDVGFTNYGTNSDLIGLYVDGSYDAAIPSDYLLPQLTQTGALHTIDWSKFSGHGLTMLNPEQMPDHYEYDQSGELLGAYDHGKRVVPVAENDPINLFNDVVKRQLSEFRSYDGAQFNLLRYGVPYFMQDLVFAYTGPEIAALAEPGKEYSWKDIMAQIGNFRDNLMIVDDERNVFSIGQAINTADGDQPSINPLVSGSTDVDPAYKAFGSYAKDVGQIRWDTDSYAVLNYMAKWEEGDQPRATILYNGDAVYGAQGGEIDNGAKFSANLHVVHPTTTVFVLDMVTISSKTDENNLPKLLDLVNELALSGTSVNARNDEFDAVDEANKVPWAKYLYDKEPDAYFNISMQNFNNVNYVSPLRDMTNEKVAEYYADNDEFEYKYEQKNPDGTTETIIKTIFYGDLYKDTDGEHKGEVHEADADGNDLGVGDEEDYGLWLYKISKDDSEDGKEHSYAAVPTFKNIQFDIYLLKDERIKPSTIEVPFRDIQQVASIRYFADMKFKLN